MLEGVDKFNNLIGSVYYPDGDSATDLSLELVQNVCYLFVCLANICIYNHGLVLP